MGYKGAGLGGGETESDGRSLYKFNTVGAIYTKNGVLINFINRVRNRITKSSIKLMTPIEAKKLDLGKRLSNLLKLRYLHTVGRVLQQ